MKEIDDSEEKVNFLRIMVNNIKKLHDASFFYIYINTCGRALAGVYFSDLYLYLYLAGTHTHLPLSEKSN